VFIPQIYPPLRRRKFAEKSVQSSAEGQIEGRLGHVSFRGSERIKNNRILPKNQTYEDDKFRNMLKVRIKENVI
jgi:hypothetical protein